VHHRVHPAFDVPYTIALVSLVEHPEVRYVANLPGAVQLQAGTPMVVRFEDRNGVALPNWDVKST
jgi:hypothetical protein